MATMRKPELVVEIEWSALGYVGDKVKMCRNLIRSEEEAKALIAEWKEKAERNPIVYTPCERYVIRKRENVFRYGDWAEVKEG